MSKFKVKDRVEHIKYGPGNVEEIDSQDNIRVKLDRPNKYGLTMWWCQERDLSHYPPSKYKLLKEISLAAIIKAGAEPSCSTFIDFATKAFRTEHLWHEKLPLEKVIEWAGENLYWLIDKGFIEEIREKPPRTTYKWGQWFKDSVTGHPMQIVYLYKDSLCAIVFDDGSGYPPVKVKNINKITREELKQLYNGQDIDDLTPINVKITEVKD